MNSFSLLLLSSYIIIYYDHYYHYQLYYYYYHYCFTIIATIILQLLLVIQGACLAYQEMESATLVQIRDEAVYFLSRANDLQKGLNLSIPLPPMGKLLSRVGSWLAIRRNNSEFKPAVFCLKIDLVSDPAHDGRFW